MKRALLPGLLLMLLGGCDELDDYLPKVRFQQLDLQEIDFEGAKVDFVFSVDNPNPVAVELSSFSYALGLQQVPFFDGDNEDGFRLEAVGSSKLVLPVGLRWDDTWAVLQETRGVDYLDFDLKGHFGFDTPLGEARIPYTEDGSFPSLRTPRFDLAALRVPHVDPWTQTVHVELDLDVDNLQASTLFFHAFQYQLGLGGGAPVATGVVSDLGQVRGDRTGRLVLPIDLDALALGDTVYQALVNNQPIQVDLAATMDVGTPFGVAPLTIGESSTLTPEG